MQVFKLFFKIIKKNMLMVCIYLGVFALITFFLLSNIEKDTDYQQLQVKTHLEIEESNQDVQDFLAYLEPYIEKTDIKTNSVEDALFWDDIDLYLKIPANFYTEICQGKQPIIMKSTPDSMESYALQSKIDQYFHLVLENIRLNLTTQEEALKYTTEQLASQEQVSIEFHSTGGPNGISSMFNTGVYVICALTLLVVGLVSFELRKTDITRRLNISPLSISKRNFLLTICYTVMSCIIVSLLVVIGFIVFKGDLIHHLGYYVMNAFLFVVVMVSLALFLSSLFKSSLAFNCVNVIFPLGVSFISGSMVDLSFMPTYTKVLGRFFPNIYIVEANNYIGSCNSFQFLEYLKIVWPCFLFILFFTLLTIVVSKRMAKSEQ